MLKYTADKQWHMKRGLICVFLVILIPMTVAVSSGSGGSADDQTQAEFEKCGGRAIQITSCVLEDSTLATEFTLTDVAVSDIKYKFTAGNSIFTYTEAAQSEELQDVTVTADGTKYTLTLTTEKPIESLRMEDTACSGTSFPVLESIACSERIVFIETTVTDEFECTDLTTIEDRVRCRIQLSEEDYGDLRYMPEECLVMESTAQDACIERYMATQQCWDYPVGEERIGCVKEVLRLGALGDEIAGCQTSLDSQICFDTLNEKAFNLIKFRFYDLEERAETLLDQGYDEDRVVALVVELEKKKQDFNDASTFSERRDIVLDVRDLWAGFVQDVKIYYGVA